MKGMCLCGAIEVTAAVQNSVEVCHCSMCRRWGGGPLLAVHCSSEVVFNGSNAPVVYASSDWAERGFCPTCGTHLFYRLLANNEYIIPVGLFASGSGFTMHSQIFIDHKPDYYDFANSTETLTEAQVFAKFSNPN